MASFQSNSLLMHSLGLLFGQKCERYETLYQSHREILRRVSQSNVIYNEKKKSGGVVELNRLFTRTPYNTAGAIIEFNLNAMYKTWAHKCIRSIPIVHAPGSVGSSSSSSSTDAHPHIHSLSPSTRELDVSKHTI